MKEFMKIVNYLKNKHNYLFNTKNTQHNISYNIIIDFLMSHNIQFIDDENNDYINYNSKQVLKHWDIFTQWINNYAFKKSFKNKKNT